MAEKRTKTVFQLIAAAILCLGAVLIYTAAKNTDILPQGESACTLEAMLCPDGSYVGRTGPNCEFAACPGELAPQGGKARIEAAMGQSAQALDVTVTPREVVEDSRCPSTVQCIWAGTVRVRATLVSGLGTANEVFTLGETRTTEAENVTLVEVRPYPEEAGEIADASYRFVFEIEKRTDVY